MSTLVAIDSSGKRSIQWPEVIKGFVLYFAMMTFIYRGVDWLWNVLDRQPQLESGQHAISFACTWSLFILGMQFRREWRANQVVPRGTDDSARPLAR